MKTIIKNKLRSKNLVLMELTCQKSLASPLPSQPIAIREIVTPNCDEINDDLNLFWILSIELAPSLFSSINLKTLLGLNSNTESSLAAKKAGKANKNKISVIFMQSQVFYGGGEDRTRLRRIMSSLHSPDCYTPKCVH